jgi:Protein of unknown function (DUF1360)
MNAIEPKLSDNVQQGYGEGQPLPQFAILAFIQSGVLLLLSISAQARRYPKISFGDLLLLGIGTHKLSRIVAKDRVTAPVRAPFTRFEKSIGSGEVEEEGRGTGLQEVIGELVSCSYCMSVWVASALLLLFIINRRLASLICKLLTLITASHFLHRFYLRLDPE